MTTPFLRLLKSEDKEAALASSIASLRSGMPDSSTVFSLDPNKFSKVPNSPFAYWVDDDIRELFASLKQLEGENYSVRLGVSTKNDVRFVRLWFECVISNHGKWYTYANGGSFSKFYYPYLAVINGKDKFRELEQYLLLKFPYLGANAGWILHPENDYTKPAIGWPLRTAFFSPNILPADTVFSARTYALYADCQMLPSIGELLSSVFIDGLLKIMLGREGFPEFVTAAVRALPIPDTALSGKLFLEAYECCRLLDTDNELSRMFSFSPITSEQRKETRNRLMQIESRIESEVATVYEKPIDKKPSYEEEKYAIETEEYAFPSSISRLVGLIYGRFDIRIADNQTLVPIFPGPFDHLPICSPAMLVGSDGFPARADNIASEAWLRARPNAISLPPEPMRSQKISAADYPLDIPWDGILVDDPEDERDILSHLHAALAYLHGAEAEAKERELCAELEVKDLRDYLRKPSLFFDAHLKRYSKSRRKAPIYWPLQTRDGRYTIWLYYPRLTADTLYGCSNILEAKLKLERRKLELARVDLEKSQGKVERARVEELSDFVAALTEMKEEIERVAGLPYKPNLDDGVQITAAPLWSLFRLPSWQKELKATWEKLENGDYDWAHLSYAIWPERVREKCRADRSLAIAHGLEDICEQKAPETKAAGKKRGRKSERPAPDEESGLDFDD